MFTQTGYFANNPLVLVLVFPYCILLLLPTNWVENFFNFFAFSQNFFISFLIYQFFHPLPYKCTFFCLWAQFQRNFLLENFSPPYKGTFFAYLVHIFEFFHKDFILASLLYSQTFFCRLAHFLRNFRKKIIPYHISERFSAVWSVFHELSAKKYLYP